MFGNNRRIEVDIVANDRSSRVYDYVGNSIQGMALKVNKGIIGINDSLNRYNNAMYGMYRSTQIAVAGTGYLFYRFTKDSVKSFAEFERQHGKTMGAIASNYDKSAQSQRKFFEDQKKLRDESIRLGTYGPTGNGALYNPKEVAYAQTELAKAGTKPKDMGTVLPDILKFAGGNDLDIGTATEYAVNLSKMFNIPTKQWGDMLDKVTRAADVSTVDVPDIFESMKYAGPIAASMNRDLTEVLGMVSVLGNVGLKGSIGGTGIQSFFTRLLSPIGKDEKALMTAPDQYTKDIFQAFVAETTTKDGKFKGVPEVTGMLDDVMGKLNDKQQAWFAHKLFGLFQMKAGFALSASGGDKLQAVIDDLNTNAKGTNNRKWDIMLGTSWGKQEAFSNLWSGVQTDIGGRLTPITNAVLDELFSVISNKGNYKVNFNKLEEGIKESARQMEEQYGVQIGNFTESLGMFLMNSSRVATANEPLAEGFASGIMKLLNGDVGGAMSEINSGINRSNKNIDNLPSELQEFAKQVRNASIALVTLSGINFASKLLENITTIYRYTIGQMLKTANMNVQASNVIVADKKVPRPIYNTGPIYNNTDGKGSKGGGTRVVGTGGKGGKGGTGVGADGKPIATGADTATIKKNLKGKISGGVNALTWAYAFGEMFGINDMLLDKAGVNGKSREYIDKGRTGLNYAFTASFVDSMLFKGMGKSLVTQASKSMYTGMQAGLAETIATMGVGATVTGGAIIGTSIATVMKDLNNQSAMRQELDRVQKEKHSWVFNDTKNPWYDPNGIITSNGKNNIIDVTEFAKQMKNNNNQYTYPQMMYAGKPNYSPFMPWTWGNKRAMDDYNAKMAFDAVDRQSFKSAQALYYNQNGKGLTYEEYAKTRDQWAKSGKIDKYGQLVDKTIPQFNAIEYMKRMDSLIANSQKPPTVNVGAPTVNVNVNVDRLGNAIVTKSIIPSTTALDTAYRSNNIRMRDRE